MKHLELILGFIMIVIMTANIVITVIGMRKRKKPQSDLLMSATLIEGYDRQKVVEANKEKYGVRNSGVTMDDREIYTPCYRDIGI